jgi:hypothetical protein
MSLNLGGFSNFMHKASSWLALATGVAVTVSQVPVPSVGSASGILMYATALLAALGLGGQAVGK